MNLKGKKLCGDHDYYIGDCFKGSNFFVYRLCKNPELTDCDELLVKIFNIQGWVTRDMIEYEATQMQKVSDLGISPAFIGLDFCKYDGNDTLYAFLIMEKYGDGTLEDLLKTEYATSHQEEIKQKLKELLDKLYDNGINHGDLHSGNILYKINSGSLEFKLIDFAESSELGTCEKKYTIRNNRECINVE
jgi:tRNA A-37 threonylcarbamoyl transferase component Bud32